jgi:hypothetical protein
MAGWVAVSLTVQPPELIYHRKVPVLRHPFRKEDLGCRGERTVMKIANTITPSVNAVRQVILPTDLMISSRAKRI